MNKRAFVFNFGSLALAAISVVLALSQDSLKSDGRYALLAALVCLVGNAYFIAESFRRASRQARKIAALKSRIKKITIEAHGFVVDKIVELRRPLQGLVGIQDLFNKSSSQAEIKDFFDIADFCARFLIRQLDRVQFFSELEQERLHFEPNKIRADKLVRDSIRMALEQANNRNVTVVEDWAKDVPVEIITAIGPVKKILTEVIDNAARYGGGRRVYLKVGYDPDHPTHILFSIYDQGPGLSDMHVKYLKAHDVNQKKNMPWADARQGLGLYLVRRLMHRINGYLNIDSRKGMGTQVTLSVPIQVPNFSADAPTKHAAVAHRRPIRTLVADDDTISSQVVGAMLRSMNAEVTTVENGREAILAAQKGRFDLILMDIDMPILDGWSASKVILKELGLSQPPIIAALTSFCRQEDFDQAKELGLLDLIPKPAPRSVIKDIIDRVYAVIEAPRKLGTAVPAEANVVIDDPSVTYAKEPGYLINFNELFRGVGENMMLCQDILFSASNIISVEAAAVAQAIQKKDLKQLAAGIHKINGEFGVVFCVEGQTTCEGLMLAARKADWGEIKKQYEVLADLVERLITEIENSSQGTATAA